MRAFALNSTELLSVANTEGSVFAPQRRAASFDYNRDGNITDTQQRRTFMTWDNDVFPRMPIDLEFMNPIDMIVGVRGRRKETKEEKEKNNKKNAEEDEDVLATMAAPPDPRENKIVLDKSSSYIGEEDNIFMRNLYNRYLEEDEIDDVDGNRTTSYYGNGTGLDDDDGYGNTLPGDSDDNNNTVTDVLYDDLVAWDSGNGTNCADYFFGNDDNETIVGDGINGNETDECEELLLFDDVFDFSGTTSDQDLCVSKQFLEITARNVKGNVYGYVFDDGTELHGYERKSKVREELEKARRRLELQHAAHPERHRKLQSSSFDYDQESLYFFDNIYMGSFESAGKDVIDIRKEIFHRWINFAKTGDPKISTRNEAASKKHTTWEPFPKDDIGKDTNDDVMPSYLYLASDPQKQLGGKRSTMVRLDELMTERSLRKARNSGDDLCSWVMDEENDRDDDFVEVLLDFNANTAFEYYVTILATMNPTINYVADREYLADMPPTLAPTTIQHFVDKSIEMSASPPLRARISANSGLVAVLFGTVSVLATVFIAFG